MNEQLKQAIREIIFNNKVMTEEQLHAELDKALSELQTEERVVEVDGVYKIPNLDVPYAVG